MAESVADLLDRLLDRRYDEAAARTLAAVGSRIDSPAVAAALADFEAEAARLRTQRLPLTPDNPALLRLTAAISAAQDAAAADIAAAADGLVREALVAAEVLQTALPLAMGVPASVMVGWNIVSAEALASVVAFQSMPGWTARLGRFAGAPVDFINRMVLSDFAAGKNPLITARDIARTAPSIPRAQANTLLRTLYLQSYKRAAAVAQAENRRIITRVRRMASLDTRVCAVCVALHGSEIPVGQPVQMHETCRCVAVADVAGVAVPFGPDGPTWFAGLDDADQRAILGPSLWTAWKAEAFALGDVVGHYQDDLYGTMLTQRSLKDLVGEQDAARFYAEARRWREPLRVQRQA